MRPLAWLLVLLLTPALLADADTGLRLLRQARRAAEAGDTAVARELLAEARTEWPGAALIAHELGDLNTAESAWDAALVEYSKGAREPHAARSAFNTGVVRSRAAEQALEEAGVPIDPSALGEVTDPAPLIEAIDAAVPQLENARRSFAESLRGAPDERARDSLAALTDRLDELAEMREALEQIEPPESDEEGEENEDSEEGDDEQEQEEDQEQDDSEGDEQQDDAQDEKSEEEPPPEEEEEQQPDAPPQAQPEPREPTRLTPQQVQELLATLEELEEEALEQARIQRAARRRSVEKDW